MMLQGDLDLTVFFFSPFLLSYSEPRKITISGFDLTEFGPSTELDYSGLTAMGRFLAGPGIGHLERLIRPSAPVEFSATKRVAKRKSKKKKASSVVVEVGSVCSLDSDRIMRDFGRK